MSSIYTQNTFENIPINKFNKYYFISYKYLNYIVSRYFYRKLLVDGNKIAIIML